MIMKKYAIWAVLALFAMSSCVKDESIYEAQQKENVKVDPSEGGQGGNEVTYPEGVLIPGIHLVTLDVTLPDGTTEERQFKYFMPISIDESKPISLIFEFHGSYSFAAGVTPSNPIANITIAQIGRAHV